MLNEGRKADPLGGLLPQEIVTGDVLRGYGPRRGNLERLLRYWRPIMKKPGGFRRCRVILANHPELYPLNNICAWLHHETTGLWPNEGCHHPGMKNCRKKMKKMKNWTDAQFARRLASGAKPSNLVRGSKKSLEGEIFFHDFVEPDTKTRDVVTEDDYAHAFTVLKDFCQMEKEFVDALRDDSNWEIVGEDEYGNEKAMPVTKKKSLTEECCGQDVEW